VAARAGQIMTGISHERSIRHVGGPFGLKRVIDEGLVQGPWIGPFGAMISQTSGHGVLHSWVTETPGSKEDPSKFRRRGDKCVCLYRGCGESAAQRRVRSRGEHWVVSAHCVCTVGYPVLRTALRRWRPTPGTFATCDASSGQHRVGVHRTAQRRLISSHVGGGPGSGTGAGVCNPSRSSVR
jgi:hypothetical protein